MSSWPTRPRSRPLIADRESMVQQGEVALHRRLEIPARLVQGAADLPQLHLKPAQQADGVEPAHLHIVVRRCPPVVRLDGWRGPIWS